MIIKKNRYQSTKGGTKLVPFHYVDVELLLFPFLELCIEKDDVTRILSKMMAQLTYFGVYVSRVGN